ncbi:MAG: hypothetical protein V4659_04085 [Pseudomonadota bacterium]
MQEQLAMHALAVIERAILSALLQAARPGEVWCLNLRGLHNQTALPKEVCRGVIRGLIDDQLAECRTGLWTDDGEPAGAGYCITGKGARLVMPESW